ncbi:AbrB family transcriptional regulator [Marimonas lutisalis]|uniref:AbrB family transcriptional regulator n=1 Tax=Marimonas lutisalis TaxID=2545756 RepID=UPI0010FA0360|nr:AbrB family transcriptional regulator [Marimonas lutisalis]
MPLATLVLTTGLMCLLGALGGIAATFLNLPLPYLLGSLIATAIVAIFLPHRLPAGYDFPMKFRILFIALIGMLIGTQVTPELVASIPGMAVSMAGVVIFVILAQWANYLIFRRIGGFDAPTAYFSGAPGGLIESITMGEASGANVQLLISQQFLRIILVIGLVPLALSLWHGYPVGSASGIGFDTPRADLTQLPLVIAAAIAGTLAGYALRLPAWQLTGALLLSAGLNLAGYPLSPPDWLVKVAQVVIGAALGMRFTGFSRQLLLRGLWLSAISVAVMLAIGATLSILVRLVTGDPFEVLLITYAPGGINEMALIALSIQANPAFVTLHHIIRLTVTVLAMGVAARHLPGLHDRL